MRLVPLRWMPHWNRIWKRKAGLLLRIHFLKSAGSSTFLPQGVSPIAQLFCPLVPNNKPRNKSDISVSFPHTFVQPTKTRKLLWSRLSLEGWTSSSIPAGRGWSRPLIPYPKLLTSWWNHQYSNRRNCQEHHRYLNGVFLSFSFGEWVV